MNEEKTSIEKLSTMNLEGLFLPEPISPSYWWVWVLLAFLLLMAMWVLRSNYRKPKAVALRELQQLRNELKENDVDIREVKHQVSLTLRQGFEVTRLDHVMTENTQWREYLSALDNALYSKEISDQKTEIESLSTLITKAQEWLHKGEQS